MQTDARLAVEGNQRRDVGFGGGANRFGWCRLGEALRHVVHGRAIGALLQRGSHRAACGRGADEFGDLTFVKVSFGGGEDLFGGECRRAPVAQHDADNTAFVDRRRRDDGDVYRRGAVVEDEPAKLSLWCIEIAADVFGDGVL